MLNNPEGNLHVFDKFLLDSSLVSLPNEFQAKQWTLVCLLAGLLISSEMTFFSFVERKLEAGLVSFPSILHIIEATGAALAEQKHLRTSPVRWHEDSGRIAGASRKMKQKDKNEISFEYMVYKNQRC